MENHNGLILANKNSNQIKKKKKNNKTLVFLLVLQRTPKRHLEIFSISSELNYASTASFIKGVNKQSRNIWS